MAGATSPGKVSEATLLVILPADVPVIINGF
jgi:hypothetical protein